MCSDGTAVSGRSRLTWTGDRTLSTADRERLLGPGGPFETRLEAVDGHPRLVYTHQPRNLRRHLEQVAARHPERILFVEGDEEWSNRRALDEIDRIAALLIDDHGVRPGDRVAIVAANSVAHGLAIWAIVSVGGIVTGLNGWWTAAELAHGIDLSRPVLILGDHRRLERLDALDLDLPIRRLDELRTAALDRVRRRYEPADPDPDDPAFILFTSGTTGTPKGAALSHRNLMHFTWANLCMREVGAVRAGAPARDRGAPQTGSILSSPLFHVSGLAGLVLTGPAVGQKLVLPPPGRWSETRHLELTQRHRVANWSGVPTQFHRLLRHPDLRSFDLSSLRTVSGGGASFPADLIRELNAAIPQARIGAGYGMTESTGLGTRADGAAMSTVPGAVGSPIATVEIEIRDPVGKVVPLGEVGEIHLRSAAVFLGYWENAEATAEVIDDEGWYRTGDFGRIVDEQLILESRMRDLIIRGGENVYPTEVEHRLVEHPDIDDAAVVGVDHEVLGQEVAAHVLRRAGSTLDADGVRTWVGETLARFKVPTRVVFAESLPYTETGKVQKHLL